MISEATFANLKFGFALGVPAAFAAPKVIVNCARRSGDAKVESRVGQEIFWLPMTEANMQEACRTYLKEYGDRLLEAW